MNQENKYLLSIIIPVYNGEKYLEQCLNSIFNAKNINSEDFDFEVILINDGSSDNSKLIYEKFKEKYNNITILENENHGVSFSRNCGIDVAKGLYVTFVDCDDLLLEDWYSLLKESIMQYDVDILYFSKYFIESSNVSKQELLSYIITYNDKNIKISGPYSKLFRKDFLKENDIRFNENIINGEDTLFNAEALLKSRSVKLLKKSYYTVRHNGTSATSSFNKNIIDSEINFNISMDKLLIDYKKEYNTDEIVNYCLLMSIRTLAIRISFIEDYKKAKEIYSEVMKKDFFVQKLKDINTSKFNMKSKLLTYLLKYRFYLLLYYLCRHKYSLKDKESYEIL